jgi:hypothetical protein
LQYAQLQLAARLQVAAQAVAATAMTGQFHGFNPK